MLLSWLAAAVVVRVGLDLVDKREYSPTSEYLYMLVAALALLTGIAGTVLAIRSDRKRNRWQNLTGTCRGFW
ncbi:MULTISPECIES: hypothetical protein [unclassified Mycolicibacterium]|uniref:hypothetical protein n=1 Tax=unclassified Mycolicibacterium TaxID=2636767 RepID=UPI0012DE0BD5|nr:MULTISPECIES: hypothetical protein [unclassified Mycolicibacterium]MUL80862.1 hypothetical protein [Mycolicibacterium sp. CBMA 329]MUL86628.1 hypothetical protein [Mycolicibacterium sp. CBMA 331]MUM02832.1 hypothetical protein [Mycolicibacterium sp. CBMA 334]MUM27676.1 hypothetical protein [Mycolicibacterium sp. CBMA 295]MUM36925.1 hypothetical protein [Mycolicibacterium sp. CBMA 247]